MSIPVKLKDIVEALDMTSDSITYYLDKGTGQIEMISEDDTAGMNLEDNESRDNQPEWLRESIAKAREIHAEFGVNFIALPDKADIHDYRIMEDFSRTYPNNSVSAALLDAIRGGSVSQIQQSGR